jgi:ferredoxin
MHVVIDESICQGHGRCYVLVPELFDANEAGFGTVTSAELDSSAIEQAAQAIASCPEGAIRLE